MMKSFVIAQDGVKVRLESPCLDGWVTPKDLKDLQTYATKPLDTDKYHGPRWIGSKMPADLMKQVLGTIHEFPKMETAYTLYYNPIEGKWAVKCPEQSGAGASVSFLDEGDNMPDGYILTGSIHTHPEMGAFWSGTDLHDQQFKAGLHIVFGLHDGLVSQNKCTVFLPNAQEDQDIWNVIEEVDFNQVYEPVAEWVETIKKQSYHRPAPVTTKWYGSGYYNTGKLPQGYYKPAANSAGYSYYPNYSGYGFNYYGGNSKKNHNHGYNYTGYGCGGAGWAGCYGYDDDYDDRYDDYDYDVPVTGGSVQGSTVSYASDESTKELKAAVLDAINDTTTAAKLVDVFLDPAVRNPMELITGLTVVDTFDKQAVLLPI
jgi:proteasome lid subunit RPN8/RPN11